MGILPRYVELTAWVILWAGVVVQKRSARFKCRLILFEFDKLTSEVLVFLVDRSSVIGPVQTSKFHETNLKH